MSDETVEWIAEVTHANHATARVGKRGDHLVAEWGGIGRLSARRDGTDVTFVPVPNGNPLLQHKIRNGAAELLLRSLAGNIGLHGSAVSIRGRAFVFLGDSGAGKSTFAAALAQRAGTRVLADDAVALSKDRRWQVVPLEGMLFLNEDAATELRVRTSAKIPSGKVAVEAVALESEPCPLYALIRLRFLEGEPSLRPVQEVGALETVLRQTIRFALDDAELLRREFASLTDLVASVPTFDLVRPRRFEAVEATMDALQTFFFGSSVE